MGPWDIGEIFSETILQLLSIGHHMITGGHHMFLEDTNYYVGASSE